jgi:hypothetical protein
MRWKLAKVASYKMNLYWLAIDSDPIDPQLQSV